VGRALAERLGFEFVDADDLVRQQSRKAIPEIFETEGETGFRKRERGAIASLAGRKGLVLSTGGGAMTDPRNVGALRALGPVILLKASPETILRRVGGGADRPMLAAARTPESRMKRIRRLLDDRRDAYAQADAEVDTEGLGVAAAAAAVLESLAGLAGKRRKGRADSP
jgi:shikimate kinase